MHVEVAVDRLHRRFGVDVDLAQPRVPYLETIRTESRARARYKKQTGGRGQFGDCEIVLEPRPGHEGYEFVDKIVGGVIPQGFRPAVDKGIQEAMLHGELAGAPVQGVTVRLVDGQYHNVDSSEMAFKIAGSMAFKDAYQKADPMLLEPIMELEVTVPDEAVGAVNGDLNSRRGRLHGMEPLGGMTTIKAEVPMAEVLTYSQSLTSLTGGRGDYHMSFLRYEEVPAHIAQKLDRGREEGPRESEKDGLSAGRRCQAVSCAIAGARCSWARTRRASRPTASSTSTSARSAGARRWRRAGTARATRACLSLAARPAGGFFAPPLRCAARAAAAPSRQPILSRLSPASRRSSRRWRSSTAARTAGRSRASCGASARRGQPICRSRARTRVVVRSPGTSRGTGTASRPTPPTGADGRAWLRRSRSSAASRTGTPTSTPPVASCRRVAPE